MDKHITLVAALQIGFGVLGILFAVIVWVAIVGGGLISGDEEAIAILGIVGSAIAFFSIIVSVPGIIGRYRTVETVVLGENSGASSFRVGLGRHTVRNCDRNL